MGSPAANLNERRAVPWQEMEKKLAEKVASRNSARAGSPPPWKQGPPSSRGGLHSLGDREDIPAPPESGVRASEGAIQAARACSFTVYSVEELDARTRISNPPTAVIQPPVWPTAIHSFRTLVTSMKTWARTKPRPRFMDTCREPLNHFRVDLGEALNTLPWGRIALRGGIALGSFLVLMFVVVMAADMTDDVKPSRTAANHITTPKVDDAPVVAAPAASVAEAPVMEIDDMPAATAKKTTAKKSSKKKKKAADPFNP